MIEIIFLFLIVLILVGVFWFVSYDDKSDKEIFSLQGDIEKDKEKLKIAQRHFMQGKIKKDIFDPLLDDLEVEMIEKELELFRIKKRKEVSVVEKAEELFKRFSKPTKYRRTRLENLLKDAEIIRHEMSLIESKLMKRELNPTVFQHMLKKKEKELINKETEIIGLVSEEK